MCTHADEAPCLLIRSSLSLGNRVDSQRDRLLKSRWKHAITETCTNTQEGGSTGREEGREGQRRPYFSQ